MFKNLVISAALGLSTLAAAGPHPAVPVAPAPMREVRAEVFDVEQGRRLQRELALVMERRDGRGLRHLDARVLAFMESELAESRRRGPLDRHVRREERASARQLTRLIASYQQLEGARDHRAMRSRRVLLADAVRIAEEDLLDGRPERFGRR